MNGARVTTAFLTEFPFLAASEVVPSSCNQIKLLHHSNLTMIQRIEVAIRENKPVNPVPKLTELTAPKNARRHRVKDNETWKSIAAQYGLSAAEIIRFNFGETKGPEEVNWYLHNYVGCSKSFDGMNYAFRTYDDPGVIWIPIKGMHIAPRDSAPAQEMRLVSYVVSDHIEKEHKGVDDGDSRAAGALDIFDRIIQWKSPSYKRIRNPYLSEIPTVGPIRVDFVLTRVLVTIIKQYLKPNFTISMGWDIKTTYYFGYGPGEKSQKVAVSYNSAVAQFNGKKEIRSRMTQIDQPTSYSEFEKMEIPDF